MNGQDLSWFFSQWIDQAVFAHWKVAADIADGAKPGESRKSSCRSRSRTILSKCRWISRCSAMRASGKSSANIMLDGKEQSIELTAPFKPVKVILDEDYWVLHHPGSDNIWPAEKAATMAH